MSNPSDMTCAICLETTAIRGGEFLTSPGCCGKWFHQSCILEMQKANKNFCPACRVPFPAAAIVVNRRVAPIPPPAPPTGRITIPPPVDRSLLLSEIRNQGGNNNNNNTTSSSAPAVPPPLNSLHSQLLAQIEQRNGAPSSPSSTVATVSSVNNNNNNTNNVGPASSSSAHPVASTAGLHQQLLQEIQCQQQVMDDFLFQQQPTPPPPQPRPQQQQRMPSSRASLNNIPPPPPPPAPSNSSKSTGIFGRLLSRLSFSSTSASSSSMSPSAFFFSSGEDEVTPPATKKSSSGKSSKGSAKSSSTTGNSDHLTLSITPEYTEEKLSEKTPFHVRISTAFTNVTSTTSTSDVEEERTNLDVVCVLDNSGSMDGEKIENLKSAMEFVVSRLSENDRLTIVTFNSSATTLHELWKMTSDRKAASLRLIQSIQAGGGTDIYAGMSNGWNLLQNRRTQNPTSCMFLLTDGQDGDHFEEKKKLAKLMRDKGTSLFIFGFGNDHDADHLIQIANAGEGSFVFVETHDTVIDAFGGAIGSQQGQLLKNIQVNMTVNTPGILIENIQAGSYATNISRDQKTATVTFADLFGGERRDFLLQLKLPKIDSPNENYPLISVNATYNQNGQEEMILHSSTVNSTIRRVPDAIYSQKTHERDIEVDAQIQRLECTKQMKNAIELADKGNYTQAKTLLENTKVQLNNSVSNRSKNVMVASLLDDLNDCENKVRSRDEYTSYGGKAYMEENLAMHSKQRVVYSKKASPMTYQSTSSAVSQSSALAFKASKY